MASDSNNNNPNDEKRGDAISTEGVPHNTLAKVNVAPCAGNTGTSPPPLPSTANWHFDPITGVSLMVVGPDTVQGQAKSGAFAIETLVGGKENVLATIDTGADSISILHESVYEKIPSSVRHLSLTTELIKGANGSLMTVKGQDNLPFLFVNTQGERFAVLVHVFVCTDLDVGCVLGSDFLLKYTQGIHYSTKGKETLAFIKHNYGEVSLHVRDTKVCIPALPIVTHNSVCAPPALLAATEPDTPPKHSLPRRDGEQAVKGKTQAHKWEEEERRESEGVKEEVCKRIHEHDIVYANQAADSKSKKAIYDLCCEYYHLFDNRKVGMARTPDGALAQHDIFTDQNSHPIKQAPYYHSKFVREQVDKQIKEWLADGTIVESNSSWSSPVVVVSKKPDPTTGEREKRICVDYRKLNQCSVKDAYPLPNIDIMLRQFGTAKIFSTLDLKSAYNQLTVNLAHRFKTAFVYNNHLYEFVRMPFGLCNAPASFQRFIIKCLLGLDNVYPYLDDIIIYSEDLNEHISHLRSVFARLSLCGVKLKLTKCIFAHTEVKFLGHMVSQLGVGVDPEKVAAVQEIVVPTNVKKLQIFLGLCNYYSKFIPDYAKICKPLHLLLRKDMPFVWAPSCQVAFELLKTKLSTAPVLIMPNPNEPFAIHTDASKDRVGAVLTQWDNEIKRERVVMYASRSTKPAEQNYGTTHLEFLAVIYALKKFQPYVYGQKFKIYTDYQPLVHIRKVSTEELTGRLGRWILYLEQYSAPGNIEIIYKQGKTNSDADAMSRLEFTNVVRSMTRAQRQEQVIESENEKQEELKLQASIPVLPKINTNEPSGIINSSTLSQAQEQDEHWKYLYEYINTQVLSSELSIEQQTLLKAEAVQYFINENGVLYHIHHINNKYQAENVVRQICVPIILINKILYELHDMHGHMSVDKTYIDVLQRYYWYSMYKDVSEYVSRCKSCLERKTPHRTVNIPTLSTQTHIYNKYGIGEALAIDYVGPMVLTSTKKIGMITLIDICGRYAFVNAVTAATTRSVVKVIDSWIDLFGLPLLIVSDNGSMFTSENLQQFCHAIEVERKCVLPYAPWANTINERFNGTL